MTHTVPSHRPAPPRAALSTGTTTMNARPAAGRRAPIAALAALLCAAAAGCGANATSRADADPEPPARAQDRAEIEPESQPRPDHTPTDTARAQPPTQPPPPADPDPEPEPRRAQTGDDYIPDWWIDRPTTDNGRVKLAGRWTADSLLEARRGAVRAAVEALREHLGAEPADLATLRAGVTRTDDGRYRAFVLMSCAQ